MAGSNTAPISLRLPRWREWRRICRRCWRQSSPIPRSGSLGCPLLPAEERRRVLIDWNDTETRFAASALFPNGSPGRPSARRTPSRCPPGAVRLSYRELARRSSAIADRLAGEGVGPDVVVILLAERGVDFLAAMIAVQQAGGAFLPLDPRLPAGQAGPDHSAQPRTAGAGRARLRRGARKGTVWNAGPRAPASPEPRGTDSGQAARTQLLRSGRRLRAWPT